MRVLVAAEDAPGVQLIRALRERDVDLVAVLCAPGDRGSRGASARRAAELAGVPAWPPARVEDPAFALVVERLAVDLFLNAYSLHVVCADVLAAARLGAYNLHPSPLPAYAGLNSVCWAVARGEQTHGVTVHRMEPLVDAGPIAYQETFPIGDEDTGLSLSTRCIRTGLALLLRLVDAAVTDPATIPALAQDLGARTYFGAGPPNGGRLTWSRPARSVRDYVRACDFYPFASPWGRPGAVIAGREVMVGSVSLTGELADAAPGAVRRDGSAVLVACSDEWIRLDTLVQEGRRLPARDVLDGVRPEAEGQG